MQSMANAVTFLSAKLFSKSVLSSGYMTVNRIAFSLSSFASSRVGGLSLNTISELKADSRYLEVNRYRIE